IASIDSSLAASINAQVFTTSTSASSALDVISIPRSNTLPSMISASTRFLAQPKLIMPTFVRGSCGGRRPACKFPSFAAETAAATDDVDPGRTSIDYSIVTSASFSANVLPFFLIWTASRSSTRTEMCWPRNSTVPSVGEIQRSKAGRTASLSTTTLTYVFFNGRIATRFGPVASVVAALARSSAPTGCALRTSGSGSAGFTDGFGEAAATGVAVAATVGSGGGGMAEPGRATALVAGAIDGERVAIAFGAGVCLAGGDAAATFAAEVDCGTALGDGATLAAAIGCGFAAVGDGTTLATATGCCACAGLGTTDGAAVGDEIGDACATGCSARRGAIL